jgi:hypothetical protein
MWVQLNSNEVLDEFGSWCAGDNSWCGDCGDHTDLRADADVKPRVFVAVDNTFLCEDCLPDDLRQRLGDDDVEVWEEESEGWTAPVVCRLCQRSIPVYVTGAVDDGVSSAASPDSAP